MAVSFGSLSRGVRKKFNPNIVYSDESDNPYTTGSVSTGNNMLPPSSSFTFTPPRNRVANYGTADYGMADMGGFGALETDTRREPTPYDIADLGSIATPTLDNFVIPIYPFATVFGEDVGKEMGYIDERMWDKMTPEERDQWRTMTFNNYMNRPQDDPPSTTGDGGNAAMAAALRDYISGIENSRTDFQSLIDDVNARYSGYGDDLTVDVAAALAKQEAAAEQARSVLDGLTPSTVSSITPADIGMGAATDYLRSIGASTADVEALKAMEDQLLASSLAGAQSYSQRVADVEQANRMAQQAAIETILQEASSDLATAEADRRMQFSEALAAEIERLTGAVTKEEEELAQRLLEARLMAAQAGVVL